MHDIGIVGAGIAGLHLGLSVLQRGVTPTLYAERKMWELARPIAEWSNAALMPPPDHVMDLIAAASNENYDDPAYQWGILSDPDATAAYIAGKSSPQPAVSVAQSA